MMLAQVILIGGVLATVGSVIFGALFVTSGEFVLATIDCNLTENPYGAGNCNSDNKVTAADGSVCQVGNLGLFTSAFTPECAAGTEYEVSSIVQPYSGDPLDFGPLFAAQTNLAGALPTLTNSSGVEFTNCDEFFSSPLIGAAMGAAAVGGLASGLDDLALGIKAGYDEGIDEFVVDLDTNLYAAAHLSLISNWNLFAAGAGIESLPAEMNATYNVSGIPGCLASTTTLASVSCVHGVVASSTTAAMSGALGLGLGLGSNSVVDTVQNGLASGTGSPALTSLPETGFWSAFDSTVLCSVACTTHRDYLVNTQAALVTAIGMGAPGLESLLASITLLISTVDGFLLQVMPNLPALTAPTVTADTEAVVVLALAGSGGPITLSNGNNVSLVEAQAFYNAVLTKSAFIGLSKLGLQAATLLPEDLAVPVAGLPSLQAWGLVCAVQGLPGTCNLRQFINASLVSEQLASMPDPRTVESLTLLNAIFSACEDSFFVTDIDTCFSTFVTVNPPIQGPVTLVDITTEAVLGAFYPLTTTPLSGTAAMIAEAATLCKDDEKDRAAIALAQQLVPAGMAGLAVAAIAAGVNLFAMQNKVVGILAGVVGLVGAGLILGGLLAVYNAPIYASVGGSDGPIEDNSFVYESGIALTYAFVLIGGGFIGGLAVLGGSALLQKDDGSTEILGKA